MEGRVLVDKKQTVVKYEVAIVECAQAQEKLKWTYRFSDEMPYSDAPETVVLLENPDIQCNMDECGNKENNMHIESVVLPTLPRHAARWRCQLLYVSSFN